MGGQGSGRKPSTETIIKRSQPTITPVGNSIFLPDYSGVKPEALKTSSVDIAASGSGVSAHSSLTELDYASAGHTGFATSAQGALADSAIQTESDPVFISLSGSLPYIPIALSGSYVEKAGDTMTGTLSGSNVVMTDGTIAGMNIDNDGTKTTFLGTAGDYNRIGDARTTSAYAGLSTNDDLLVTGSVESLNLFAVGPNPKIALLNTNDGSTEQGFMQSTYWSMQFGYLGLTGANQTGLYLGRPSGNGKTQMGSIHKQDIVNQSDIGNVLDDGDNNQYIRGYIGLIDSTQPATIPNVSGSLYVSGGALYYLGSGGTNTLIGAS